MPFRGFGGKEQVDYLFHIGIIFGGGNNISNIFGINAVTECGGLLAKVADY